MGVSCPKELGLHYKYIYACKSFIIIIYVNRIRKLIAS